LKGTESITWGWFKAKWLIQEKVKKMTVIIVFVFVAYNEKHDSTELSISRLPS
jgi:hypothetical protein